MTIVPVVPPTATATTPTFIVPVVPAFMASLVMTPLTTVMPVTPAVNRRIDTGHIHHPGWWWRGVDHAGWQGIHHRPGNPHLGIHREMADAGVNRYGRLDHHRMGATHLCKSQAQQAEQRHGS